MTPIQLNWWLQLWNGRRILWDKDKQLNWRRMIREGSIFEQNYYLHHHVPSTYSEFACHWYSQSFILIRTTMTCLKADGSCDSDLQRRRREHDTRCLDNNHYILWFPTNFENCDITLPKNNFLITLIFLYDVCHSSVWYRVEKGQSSKTANITPPAQIVLELCPVPCLCVGECVCISSLSQH